MKNDLFLSLLYALDIPYTEEFSEERFQEHPYHDSLLGISLLLKEYGVPNQGLRLDNKNDICRISPPFVAQVSGNLVVVTRVTPKQVTYVSFGESFTVLLERFLSMWSGIALLPFPDEDSGEPDYQKHRAQQSAGKLKKRLIWIFVVLLVALLFGGIHDERPWLRGVLLLLNGCGLAATVMLEMQVLNIENRLSERLCSMFHKSSCNQVLETPGARILWGITWTEAGYAFFMVNGLVILLLPSLIPVLSAVSVCALPYTFWSVWYQKFKAGSWCPLCLSVQLLFWLQFLVFLFSGTYRTLAFNRYFGVGLIGLGLGYLLTVLVLNRVFAIYRKSRLCTMWKYAFRNITLRHEVFHALLSEQKVYDTDSSLRSSILLGDPSSPHRITVFSNPYCNPCAGMHARLGNLIRNGWCVRYQLTSFGPEYEEAGIRLISVWLHYGAEKAEQAFDEWYAGGKSLGIGFFQKYPVGDLTAAKAEYERHRAWQQHTRLSSTPTILLEGRILPPEYKVEDLLQLV